MSYSDGSRDDTIRICKYCKVEGSFYCYMGMFVCKSCNQVNEE